MYSTVKILYFYVFDYFYVFVYLIRKLRRHVKLNLNPKP
jgi:hypothetical protein